MSDDTLTFGECGLKKASAQLTRDGRVVPLTPKAYDVLRYLVEHAGRLVTKQELLDACWPEVFVGDAALKVCIREIPQGPRRRGPEAPVHRDCAPARLSVHRGRRRCPRLVVAPLTAAATAPPARPLDIPRTHYAHSGDVNIAYQVLGEGPSISCS